MVFILQYKMRTLRYSLCYRQNIDKPQLISVSCTIFTLHVPILGSSSLIFQKFGAVIDRCQIRSGQKLGGVKIPQSVPKQESVPPRDYSLADAHVANPAIVNSQVIILPTTSLTSARFLKCFIKCLGAGCDKTTPFPDWKKAKSSLRVKRYVRAL